MKLNLAANELSAIFKLPISLKRDLAVFLQWPDLAGKWGALVTQVPKPDKLRPFTVSEAAAMQKLPVPLRQKLAPLLGLPELGEDKRGKHWATKNISGQRSFEVRWRAGRGGPLKKLCSLEEAAASAFLSPTELEEAMKPKGYGPGQRGGVYTALIDNDEITIKKVTK